MVKIFIVEIAVCIQCPQASLNRGAAQCEGILGNHIRRPLFHTV